MLFCGFLLTAYAEDDTTKSGFDKKWLEKGCSSVVVCESDGKVTEEQDKAAARTVYWFGGFLAGINSMCITNESNDCAPLTYPPEEWADTSTVAMLVLQFIKSHPDIPDDTPASRIMMAFYYICHPRATERQKLLGQNMIKRLIK